MIFAIDPGATGAIAYLTDLGALIGVDDMPTIDKMVSATLLASSISARYEFYPGPHVAVVEQVASMPRQGVSTTFKFGTSYGIALGVVGALGLRLELVTPAKWKRDMRLSSDKDEARRRAIERWPERAELFARKKDDGRAEACLLAEWWRTKGAER